MLLYTRVQVLQVWQSTEVKRDILRWQSVLKYLRIDELSENVMQQILELCHRRRNCLGWLKDQSETIFWVNWNSLWAHLVESMGIVYFISQWAHWMVSVLTFSYDGECVDFFHHVMKELTFHNVVKVQSSCCLCPSAVAQKSLTHDVPTCL